MKKYLYMTIAVIAACLGMSSCDDMPHYTDLPHIDFNPKCWTEVMGMEDSTVSVNVYVSSDYPVDYLLYSTSADLSSPVRVEGDVNSNILNYIFSLTDLLPATTYYYAVYTDYKGYTLSSDVMSFTTPEYSLPPRQLSIAELNMISVDGYKFLDTYYLMSYIYAAFKTPSGYMQFGNTIFDGITGTEGNPWTYTLDTPVTVNDGDSGDVIFGVSMKGFDNEGNMGSQILLTEPSTWPYRGVSEYSYAYPAMSVNLRCPLALVTINFTVEEEMTIKTVELWNSDNHSLYGGAKYNVLDDSFVLTTAGSDVIGKPLSYTGLTLSPNSTTSVQFVVIPQKLTEAPRLYYETSGGKFVPLPVTPGEWGKYSTTVYECHIAAERITIQVGRTTINGWNEQDPVEFTVK